jgi:ParB family transcriptional regulator, chromosome partitioning protein
MELEISLIKVRQDWNIRRFNHSDCAQLIASIEEIGLQHPIVVNANHELVSGHRRLYSCTALGWKKIPVRIMEYKTDLHERIAHIDENLLAKAFSEKELEKALAERKRLWDLLYPASTKPGPKSEDTPKPFAKDAAEKTGKSEREIRKLTRRVEEVTPEVREAYEESKISSTQIDELARLTKDVQNKVLEKVIGLSVAETKLMVDDVLRHIKAKHERKSEKSDNSVDDRAVQCILEADKTIRQMETSIVFMESFLKGRKHIFLDESHYKLLQRKAATLRDSADNFLAQIEERE